MALQQVQLSPESNTLPVAPIVQAQHTPVPRQTMTRKPERAGRCPSTAPTLSQTCTATPAWPDAVPGTLGGLQHTMHSAQQGRGHMLTWMWAWATLPT